LGQGDLRDNLMWWI